MPKTPLLPLAQKAQVILNHIDYLDIVGNDRLDFRSCQISLALEAGSVEAISDFGPNDFQMR